tara:strand:- start:168 stop:464 length:297 start_codon:yes stop_codon:yes gene_type:complete
LARNGLKIKYMETNMNQKSLDAFESIKDDVSKKQLIVLKAIKELGMATNRMLAIHLGWEINRVTGRVNELTKKGFVKCAGDHLDLQTGRTVNAWKYNG